MEYYGFIDAGSKYKTVHAIEKELMHEGLFRYKNEDDFGLLILIYSLYFWFINSLYKMRTENQKLFDELLSYGNHLGLFSEDIDFSSKRLLGISLKPILI